jgi:hypothetical protein
MKCIFKFLMDIYLNKTHREYKRLLSGMVKV